MGRSGLLSSLAVFSCAFLVGYYSGSQSWRGIVYLDDGTLANSDTRTPAAIKRELDFSHLNGADLLSATQKRLVTAARTIVQEKAIGVELGHFVTRDENGQRKLACDGVYDRLTLRFDAEGIASSGDKSSMVIDGPCKISEKDLTSIEPIWIPVSELLESPPTNVEFSASPSTKVTFFNMTGSWPVMWSLQSIRLYHSSEAKNDINISYKEIRELRKPFIMDWRTARAAK